MYGLQTITHRGKRRTQSRRELHIHGEHVSEHDVLSGTAQEGKRRLCTKGCSRGDPKRLGVVSPAGLIGAVILTLDDLTGDIPDPRPNAMAAASTSPVEAQMSTTQRRARPGAVEGPWSR